jgi:UDP-N-acetylmuramate: L-alanyl-gamma-D-glutamyl-meso-diaminopimelate ligase
MERKQMHIHILGICGTFMGGIALLAKAQGHRVSGSDANVYPPMSTQLEEAGIELMEGYSPDNLAGGPDCVVVGNALSRGNPEVEHLLNSAIPYTSGPQWLAEHVLNGRWVLAVAGTHGKTSTSSLLAWILEDAGLTPGFLIGGVPGNFGVSARLGEAPFFVVEADEYDTAFFDKRSKFVHYRPRTLVMNNLEFDHADIFDDLTMIQRQFHHLVRTVPGNGLMVVPGQDTALNQVLEMGCWTPLERFQAEGGALWHAVLNEADGSRFEVFCGDDSGGGVEWELTGRHRVNNALAAIAAARHAGVPARLAVEALGRFRNVKRRMELVGEINGIRVFDDFAHHPTAIRTTLEGVRAQVKEGRIIAVLEPRSNTMRMGTLAAELPGSLAAADQVLVYSPEGLKWNASDVFRPLGERVRIFGQTADIVERLAAESRPGDTLVVMSNGGFEGIHRRIVSTLEVAERTE